MLSRQDVIDAARRIAPYVHRTPVMQSEQLDRLAGCRLFFKAEHLQKVGAFKTRGAINAVCSLAPDEAARGVATHSSGNHGAALARAARLRGIPAWIVVPSDASDVKKSVIAEWGATIIESEPGLPARERTLSGVLERTGATEIHPYDDDRIIAGQGTAALELLEQVRDIDSIVVPVGGGGLLAGSLLVSTLPVYGAEPEAADDAFRSLQTGCRVTRHEPDTVCDGLQTTLGERNFRIIRDRVEDILLVSETEILAAMKLVWTRLKQVIEPSSATTLAAVLRNPERFSGRRVGLILTGGNISPDIPVPGSRGQERSSSTSSS